MLFSEVCAAHHVHPHQTLYFCKFVIYKFKFISLTLWNLLASCCLSALLFFMLMWAVCFRVMPIAHTLMMMMKDLALMEVNSTKARSRSLVRSQHIHSLYNPSTIYCHASFVTNGYKLVGNRCAVESRCYTYLSVEEVHETWKTLDELHLFHQCVWLDLLLMWCWFGLIFKSMHTDSCKWCKAKPIAVWCLEKTFLCPGNITYESTQPVLLLLIGLLNRL